MVVEGNLFIFLPVKGQEKDKIFLGMICQSIYTLTSTCLLLNSIITHLRG